MEGPATPFSDLIAGYMVRWDGGDSLVLRTSDGREYPVRLKPNTYDLLIRNLGGEPLPPDAQPQPATPDRKKMLVPGTHLFAYGIFYPRGGKYDFEAQFLVFVGQRPGEYLFESPDWWVRQIRSLADFYLKAQFGFKPVDYADYRTIIKLSGEKPVDKYRQETDTLSRLVYGFATAYLLTGEDRYLDAAEKGTEYLRRYMRFRDKDLDVVYWYHGLDIDGHHKRPVFASEFGEDFRAIPAYEQIYAARRPGTDLPGDWATRTSWPTRNRP